MGIFDKFKSQRDNIKEEETKVPWNVLSAMDQLDTISEESNSTPVAIFKHSTRCGISRMVLRQFEGSYSLAEDQFKIYFLDLLQHRDISNEIAARFQVFHESPQLIVIKDGKAVHSDSHHSISAHHLSSYV